MGPRSKGRLAVALGVLGLLALLAWRTLEPGSKAQKVTLLLLGFFAVRVLLDWRRSR